MKKQKTIRLVLASMFLALAFVLPFLTAQIREIGNALCPMHFPVILCGFICGPWWGLAVGIIAPILRSAVLGMPIMFPSAICMALELGTYGLLSGLMYRIFGKRKLGILLSLIIAMVGGRIVWGISRAVCAGLDFNNSTSFGISAFWNGAVLGAIPGITLQLILIPLLTLLCEKLKK